MYTQKDSNSRNHRKMGLAALPPELLEQVIAHTLPEGFEALAISCKYIYAVCMPFIPTHNELCAQFTNFRYLGRAGVKPHNIWTAFDLLAHMALEPVIARYIRYADFRTDCFRSLNRYPDRAVFRVDVEDEDYGGTVFELLAGSRHLQRAGLLLDEYWKDLKQELLGRDRPKASMNYSQHAAAFVLTLLPNVLEVKLPVSWISLQSTNALVNAIVDDASRPKDAQKYSSLARCIRFQGPLSAYGDEEFWHCGLHEFPQVQSSRSPEATTWPDSSTEQSESD